MSDVKASIPRTPAQHVLLVVSVLMAILGVLVLVALAVGLVAAAVPGGVADVDPLVVPTEDMPAFLAFVVVVVVVAALLLVTAWLGVAASRDSSRVGPYRFLCYLVGLVTLVAIAWSWGAGSVIIFDPVVLFTTVVYVIVCASLADQVQKEHDRGIVGTTHLRTRDQRVLHLLSSVMVFTSVMRVGLVIVMWLAVAYVPEEAAASVTTADSVVALASALIELLVALMGLRGSDVPKHIKPFTILVGIGFAFNAFAIVAGAVVYGLGAVQASQYQDLLWLGGCLYLSAKIWRQPPLEAPTGND